MISRVPLPKRWRYSVASSGPAREVKRGARVRSLSGPSTQKYGSDRCSPVVFELPNEGIRKPLARFTVGSGVDR